MGAVELPAPPDNLPIKPSSALAVALLGAGAAIPIFFGASIFLLAPGKQLPFNFLDDFYPPRLEEKKAIKKKIDDREKAAAEAKAKEKAAEKAAADAAKAKEEAEAKAKEVAAAKATAKAK